MTEFTRFKDLAPEIRRMIWRHALEEESSSRIILVHRPSLRIMPFKSLVSPIMLATHESRLCGKEFYNIYVDIYAMPSIEPDGESFEGWSDQEDFEDREDDVEDEGEDDEDLLWVAKTSYW
ncbi:hypothetical protein PG993_013381 [Apiospora rasikravindrae]|uniref:2EXR domain-containing protein n=1 Tax=Apiospora rasikravindrae TaxID=990691 RepID=A0ABR1RXI3_9PEZI